MDLLKVYWLPAPVFIMGLVAALAGCLAATFPETRGCRLPDTKEQVARQAVRNIKTEILYGRHWQ